MLAWAMEILAKETENKTFGEVTFMFKNGNIIKSDIMRSEVPPASIDKKNEPT